MPMKNVLNKLTYDTDYCASRFYANTKNIAFKV